MPVPLVVVVVHDGDPDKVAANTVKTNSKDEDAVVRLIRLDLPEDDDVGGRWWRASSDA